MAEKEQFEHKEDAYSKAVRAGKRTYFFDVKHSKNNDYFLTITESKRIFQGDGKFAYEKHKIFLYREDFEKFYEGLQETLEFIKKNAPELIEDERVLSEFSDEDSDEYSDLKFDDLDSQ